MSAEDELAELQAAFEEYKESSAAIEEDLEQVFLSRRKMQHNLL